MLLLGQLMDHDDADALRYGQQLVNAVPDARQRNLLRQVARETHAHREQAKVRFRQQFLRWAGALLPVVDEMGEQFQQSPNVKGLLVRLERHQVVHAQIVEAIGQLAGQRTRPCADQGEIEKLLLERQIDLRAPLPGCCPGKNRAKTGRTVGATAVVRSSPTSVVVRPTPSLYPPRFALGRDRQASDRPGRANILNAIRFPTRTCWCLRKYVLQRLTVSDLAKRQPPRNRARAWRFSEMRIAVAELVQETDSFSPLRTGLAEFESYGLYRGDEILARCRGAGPIGGLLEIAAAQPGKVELVPLLRAVGRGRGSRSPTPRFRN